MTTNNTTQNDRIAGSKPQADDPAVDGDAYTTGTTTVLATVARAFVPATNGTLTIDFSGSAAPGRTPSTNVGITVLAGFYYPICFSKIYAASPSGTILY